MAFVKVIKSAMGARLAQYEIRMGSQLQSATQQSRNVYFAITRAVVDDVGWEIIHQEGSTRNVCYIDVHEGTGTDAGFLLLMQATNSKGYSLGTTKDKHHTFAFGLAVSRIKHYALNELPVDPEPVEFTVDKAEHTILIQCPDWLRYNTLSVPEEVPPPPPPHVEVRKELEKATPPAVRGKENAVTASRNVLELVGKKPELADDFPLNRQERRTLAKKVATTIGKR